VNRSEGLVAGELLMEEAIQKRIPIRAPEQSRVGVEPMFPGKRRGIMQLVHKFKEEVVVHMFQVPNPQSTTCLGLTNLFPSKQTLGALTFFLPCPEKGSSPGINAFSHSRGQEEGGHVVDREAAKNCVHENNSPPSAKKPSFPPG